MAYCISCGQELADGAKFCVNCGTPTQNGAHQESNKRRSVYEGEIRKCPNCGEIINSFVSICPACGVELNSKRVSSALQDFIKAVNECEQIIAGSPQVEKTGWAFWSKSRRFWWVVLNILFICIPLAVYIALPLIMVKSTPKLTKEEKRMASLIENFLFPNDRESILSALVFVKEKIDFISKETINRKNAYWVRLWCAKAEQLKQKADMMFPNDTIVRDSYNEISANENRVNKVIKIKAIGGLVVLVAAIIFLVVRYGDNIGITNNKDYDATFEWQTTGLFAELPEPDSHSGKIVMETEQQINFELYNISEDDFNAYVKKCRDDGFTKEVTKTDGVFYATDEDGYDLNLFYDAKKDVLVVHISAYDLGGANNNDDNGQTNNEQQTTTTAENNDNQTDNSPVLANGVIANSNDYLKIKEVGYQMVGEYLTCAVVLNNPSSDTAIEFPAFRVTVYDENGKVLGSEERILSIIYPKQDFIDQGTLIEVSKKPSKIDVTVLEPDNYNITSSSMLDHPQHKQMYGKNISVDDDKITGELYNPNDYKIDSAMITVIFRNADGIIVSSEVEFVDQVPANGSLPFDISLASDATTTDRIEVYGYIW